MWKKNSLLDKGWIAITDNYLKVHNYEKALYFIEKAIHIDGENVLYWKRYARINLRLQHLEEAEHGFRRTLELGNYELETWLSRTDLLIKLGEFNAATNNLFQATEFYPENAEIEFRLAGLFYVLKETSKAEFHLKNGLKFNPEFLMILEVLFPKVYLRTKVRQIIAKHKNTSV